MKNIILLLAILIASSNLFKAHANELPAKARLLIFEAIGDYVYFEDEGYSRYPQNANDFTYTITDEFKIRVTGWSYSAWDMKKIGYDCLVNVNTRGIIMYPSHVEVEYCELENENWPHM
jgi:hypothetical protein